MRSTVSLRRRLILGMSIEDARSKFDSPESRVALRLAHERHNQGVYHELTLAQRRRNQLPPERRCHLVRHTKPTVKGFQSYIKSCPEDYVVREIWRDDDGGGREEELGTLKTIDSTEAGGSRGEGGRRLTQGGEKERKEEEEKETMMNVEDRAAPHDQSLISAETTKSVADVITGAHAKSSVSAPNGTTTASTITPYMSLPPTHVGDQVSADFNTYKHHRAVVINELTRVADTLGSDAQQQLKERRENGTLLAIRQGSVVDRLVDNVKEAKEKGYTSLSSSSHLLEPLSLSTAVCSRKEKHILEAFRSPFISLPAEEHDISLSLWVAGSLIEKEEFGTEFPYHIAKHIEPEVGEEEGGGGAVKLSSSNRLPRASIEVYFSTELYQLKQVLGMDGILALRRFIGRAMRRQHDPLPTTTSILLNMRENDEDVCGIYKGEETQIPWLHLIKTKVSSLTGTVLEMSSEEAPSMAAMQEAIYLVWRIWGHLVKDLHVHGDLDYLYLSVWPKMEEKTEEEVMKKEINTNNNSNNEVGATYDETSKKAMEMVKPHKTKHKEEKYQQHQQQEQQYVGNSIRSMGDAVKGLIHGADSSIWKGFNSRKSHVRSVIVPTDFIVVECTLEKKGLPHRVVIEDLVESLTELQREAMEMQRLAVVQANSEEREETYDLDTHDDVVMAGGVVGGKAGGGVVRPVLYAPKIVVSHAGVIDAAAHGFQRIRIRGSCLAHVEALARALQGGEHFTNREGMSCIHYNNNNNSLSTQNTRSGKAEGGDVCSVLPPNLSFSATHNLYRSSSYVNDRKLLGHRVPSHYAVQRHANGQFHRYQTLRPLQNMIVNKDEREFWNTHYYRLTDIRLLFHDRVSTVDIENPNKWSPTLKNRLLEIGQSRHKQQQQQGDGGNGENMMETVMNDSGESTARGKKSRRKKTKAKQPASLTLHDILPTMSPEKLYEFLCLDMEVETAVYDFKIGDNDGYSYRVKLRRIPQNHLPLVKPAMRSLEQKGFINYFGTQRFASYTKQNMHPGLHLLKGEFRAAASIIVQQFYMDTDISIVKGRNGSGFPKMYHSKAAGYKLSDSVLLNSHQRRRSIAEHGTTLQSILNNALQASCLLDGDDDDKFSSSSFIDPCEETFLRVVGPNACLMLVHEFLAFVWNDIVNQRFQRYGTFAILPGDLVRRNPLASPHSKEYKDVVFASKNAIDKGKYTFSDVVLPLPGMNIQLPENHTTDLYIVTLQRMGILFNPETKQWDIFRPRQHFSHEESYQRANGMSSSSSSPYHRFSSSFSLLEEELGSSTTIVEPINYQDMDTMEDASFVNIKGEKISSVPLGSPSRDASHLRRDLRQGDIPGNPLGVHVCGFYRHVLINPSPTMKWQIQLDSAADPHQRWALGVRQAFPQSNNNSKDVMSVAEYNVGNPQQHEQGQQLFIGQTSFGGKSNYGRTQRRRTALPPLPYWLLKKNEACLDLSFELPSSVYPSMLLRELTKSDVNSPETVDLDKPVLDTRAKSWNDLRADQQETYKKHLAKKRQKLFATRPRAINLALLHQHIFRSGGMRRSLLPSMRGYDNVSK